MTQIVAAIEWLADPHNWTGPAGILTRVLQHLGYSVMAVVVAAAVAVPLGIYIGHTGRGRTVAVALSGAVRALPTLGLLTLLAVSMGLGLNLAIVPSTIVLALLAIPSLLAATYSGIDAVDDDVVDGARASGLSERQIILRVELPLAGPIMVGGLRAAMLQVLATATISAYLGLGGLGRFILDGLAVSDYPRMLGGAIVVCVLALIIDATISALQRFAVPRGVEVALGSTT